MQNQSNISDVVSKKLCNACGGCHGICPSDAIYFTETNGGHYFPVIDDTACTHCGLCMEICPGAGLVPSLMSELPADPFKGYCIGAYVGKALNSSIYDNAQSGGIASALLVDALESRRIKSAITVSMEFGNPPRPSVKYSRNINDILNGQKSKYCPVPLLSFLRDLREKDCPTAVVGTSCQIHGLRNVLFRLPKLRTTVAFTVGLVCDRVLTYAALDYLVTKSEIDPDTQVVLNFRDKSVSNYPGDVLVTSVKGQSVIMPSNNRLWIKDYFTPARCRICFDKMNVFSDITVGDPHGITGVDRKRGETVVIARTEKGREVIRAACHNNSIALRLVSYKAVLAGQGIHNKREQWRSYVEVFSKMGYEMPNYVEIVKTNAPLTSDLKQCFKNIFHSESLDHFSNRQDLITFVDRMILKRRFLNIFFSPLRLIIKIFRKFINFFMLLLSVP